MYGRQDQAPGLDFSRLTFGQKTSLAITLSIQNGLSLFLATFLGFLILAYISIVFIMLVSGGQPMAVVSGADASVGSVFSLLFVSIAIIFLFQFFLIGICSLALRYVDGEPAGRVSEVVFSPWKRFPSIAIPVILWSIIFFICVVIAICLVNLIPAPGWLLYLPVALMLSMTMTCAMFYIADKNRLNYFDALMQPFKMLTGKFLGWLGTMVFLAIVLVFPFALVVAIFSLKYGFSDAGFMFIHLLALFYVSALSIFYFFFMALTYKQSKASLAILTDPAD